MPLGASPGVLSLFLGSVEYCRLRACVYVYAYEGRGREAGREASALDSEAASSSCRDDRARFCGLRKSVAIVKVRLPVNANPSATA